MFREREREKRERERETERERERERQGQYICMREARSVHLHESAMVMCCSQAL